MGATWQPGQSGNPSGRPRGATNRRSRAILAEARELGVEPIAVMLDAMAHFLQRANEAADGSEQDALILQAVEVASLAAPYCHPKLRQSKCQDRTDRPSSAAAASSSTSLSRTVSSF